MEGEGNSEERLECLSEPTIGADILNWPVREDLVVDCRRELMLQVRSKKVGVKLEKKEARKRVLVTPASRNLMCIPDAESISLASTGLMYFIMSAGSPTNQTNEFTLKLSLS